jgi:hypothetical protein
MDPVLVYASVLLIPVALAVALRYVIVVPRRECLGCDRSIATTAPKCRHCGYRYSFEDRRLMEQEVARRKRRYSRVH